MAEIVGTGGRVSFAPLGSTLRFIGDPVDAEPEPFDLRYTYGSASISFEVAMTRRAIRRMIRMLHIRRTPAALRQAAMHTAYRRLQKRRSHR